MRKWAGFGMCLVLGLAVLVWASVEGEKVKVVRGVDDLLSIFSEHQYIYLRIAPPDEEVFFQPFVSVLPVDWSDFEKKFAKQLYPEMDSAGYPIYRLSIYEDPVSRDTVFLNTYGVEIYRVAPASDYDPYAWQTEYFGLKPGEQLEDPYRWYYDPTRVGASVILIPERFYDSYQSMGEVAASFESGIESGGMRMSLPATVTTLMVGIERSTNGTIEVQLGWPTGFTNHLEIFATTNLVEPNWQVVYTNITTSGATNFLWIDEEATNLPLRFYACADADTDSDGDSLTDGRELLLYGTDPGDADSDGDFMDDAWELENELDPNNDLDMILDPDHDMLPNVYEHYYGLDPHTNDSVGVTKLRVDPANATQSNIYASIGAAFAASSPYSVIEIAPGVYRGGDNTGLDFPGHPVLLMSDDWGTNREVEIQSALPFAFALNSDQDNRTVIRGLNVELLGGWPIQFGFYLGRALAPFTGAAPFFDGVRVVLSESGWTAGIYGMGPSEKTVRFNNCILRGPEAGNAQFGIYLANAPAVHIANCSFLNFSSTAVTSSAIALAVAEGVTGQASIESCFWDASFGTGNNYAVIHLDDSADRYQTQISFAVAPDVGYFSGMDGIYSMTQTNETALGDGLILSNSACIGAAGAAPLTWYDFHGQTRDGSPDIGADEYSAISTNTDTDSDGLTDYDEAFVYGTSIFDADSDNDRVKDGDEVADGTQPTNRENYCVTILGTIDDQTGLGATIRANYNLGTEAWGTNVTTVVTGQFSQINQIIDSPHPVVAQVLVDLNGNGVTNYSEPCYCQTVTVTDRTTAISFVLRDADNDGVDDTDEIDCETDPNHPHHYCVTLKGTVTNESGWATGTLYAAAVLMDGTTPPTPLNMAQGEYDLAVLKQVEIASNGTFSNEHVVVDQRGSNTIWELWLDLYQDINTNGTMEFYEPNEQILVNITNHTMTFNAVITTNEVDLDYDSLPDWWEAINGLSWTNPADRFTDFDGDWIENKWEYILDLDPNSSNANSYAFADAMRAVESRIAGTNPTNAIRIFTSRNYSSTNYIRNTNCWAADIDLTCCSPWNSDYGFQKAGTLISPRHVLFAAHYQIDVGETLHFVESDDNAIVRTLIGTVTHPDYIPWYPDLTVGLLDEDVPTNTITFAAVLPDDYQDYLGAGEGIPVLCLDQEEKALIADVEYVTSTNDNNRVTWFNYPVIADRVQYSEELIGGDSGNPVFLLLNNNPVLLTVWTSGGAGWGTSVTWFKSDINQMMADLDEQYNGVTNGYQLTEIDLSGFEKVTD